MKVATSILIIVVLALASLGMVMIFSVSPVTDSMRYLSRQLIAAGLGVTGAIIAANLDYRRFRAWSGVLFGLAILLLGLVLVVGVKSHGARRWLAYAGFQFQPSDFAKLALLVALAHYGAAHRRLMSTLWQGVVVPLFMVGAVVGLVFLEPDWGTALLLGATSVVVLLVAGVRWRYLVVPMVLGVAAVAVLLAFNPVRIDRFNAWLNPETTKSSVGYQAWQAKLALGNGGPTGVGLDESTQKIFLPEPHTDFIFAIIGEEFGYAGAVVVLALFVTYFLAGVQIARHCVDPFGRLLATGLSFLIGLQALINLGVVSGALPNKGLALPFVSYGGSNLMMMLLCTGVLISVARGAGEPEAIESELPDLAQPQLA